VRHDVHRRIGNVAAGRDVEIVEQDGIGAGFERDLDVPAILLAATMVNVFSGERHLGEDRHAVVGLHALDQPVRVAQPLEGLVREELVRALGLLQAQHIGLAQPEIAFDVIDPQTDRIDVPGGDGKAHLTPNIVDLGPISTQETRHADGRRRKQQHRGSPR
jgi:hypothetical protein